MTKKILVIEDDPNMLESIGDILSIKEDYKIIKASSGSEAISKISNHKPDLILSDVMLPDLDGYKILEKIRQYSTLSFTPFIFLTARAELNDIRKGMAHGADDYLTKPFKAKDLLDAVELRLKKSQSLKSTKSEIKIKEGFVEEPVQNDWLLIKDREEVNFVKIPEIISITAQNNYSEVLIGKKKHMVRRSLKSWENTISKFPFLRIHRSTIINLSFVEKFEKASNNSYILKMKNTDEVFVVSRRYASKIKSRMIA